MKQAQYWADVIYIENRHLGLRLNIYFDKESLPGAK
jgi:hypothetical protein